MGLIDHFTVFHRGGVVLFSRALNPVKGRPVDALVQNVLLEEKKGESSYKHHEYTLKWTFDNELDLVFVAVYLNLTQMLYMDELLEAAKREFCSMYRNDVRFMRAPEKFKAFEGRLEQIIDSFERSKAAAKTAATETRRPRTFAETKKAKKVDDLESRKSKKKRRKDSSKTKGGGTGDTDDGSDDSDAADNEADDLQADNPASSPDEGDRSAQHERKHSSSAVSSDEVKQPLESDSEYVHVDKTSLPTDDRKAAARAPLKNNGSAASMFSSGAEADDESSAGGTSGLDSDRDPRSMSPPAQMKASELIPEEEEDQDSDGEEAAMAKSSGLKGLDKLKQLQKAGANRMRGGKPAPFKPKAKAAPAAAPGPAASPSKQAAKNKEQRSWGDQKLTDADMDALDYSKKYENQPPTSAPRQQKPLELPQSDDESEPENEEVEDFKSKESEKGGGWGGWFKSFVTGKELTKADLVPVMEAMRTSLISKNVAMDVAEKLCESVAASLEGKKVGALSSVKAEVKKNMEEALTRILTPKKSVDVLQGVLKAKSEQRPYVVVFVGVNGVGKSTSLSKVAAYFMAKHLKVSVAACDTFRSGAVEQLRTHSKNLGLRLFDQGYGKDAAGVAQRAIMESKKLGDDVVLVDTAGRMQDNAPLMQALAQLIQVNKPDLVLFVGEALVGNDAVDQLVKFNRALVDHSKDTNPQTVDGIILTKFDTIDDKVGAAISMTHTTGQPIVFVGCGQDYKDLKRMNVKLLVKALLQ